MGVLITPGVTRDIARIIAEHHAAVAAVLFGPDAVSEHDWQLATDLGIVDPAAPPEGVMASMHTYGAMLAHLEQAHAQKRYGMTEESFAAEVKRNPVPMTEQEHHAAKLSAKRAGQYIVGLGNKVGATVGSSLIEADRALDKKMRGTIRDVVAARFGDEEAQERMRKLGTDQGLGPEFYDNEFRKTVREVASDIGHATNDWARDVQRIAQTETHTAISEGMVESWKEQADQLAKKPRNLVFKIPRPDACPNCVSLHLEGGVPRVYDLDEVEGNSNMGEKARNWRFTIASVHPWCACQLARVPWVLSGDMPKGWHSGATAPSVIGPGGRLAGIG
jgi:hypothetical protein